MSFPVSPIDDELYTNPRGTRYQYDSTSTAWKIVSQEITGATGIQGIQGVTGAGVQGTTGVIAYTWNDSTFAGGQSPLDLGLGLSQRFAVQDGASDSTLSVTGGVQGGKYTLQLQYEVNQAPATTSGIYWSPTEPVFSGYTGVQGDVVSIMYDGTSYLGQAAMGFI